MSRYHGAYDWRPVDPVLKELTAERLPKGVLHDLVLRFGIPYGSISERRRRLQRLARLGQTINTTYSRRWNDEDNQELLVGIKTLAQKLGRSPLAVARHLEYLESEGLVSSAWMLEEQERTAGESGANP